MPRNGTSAETYARDVARQLAPVIMRRIGELAVAALEHQRGGRPRVPAAAGPWLDIARIGGREQLILSEWDGSELHMIIEPLAGVQQQGRDRVLHIGHRQP